MFPIEQQLQVSCSSLCCNGSLMLTVPTDAAENLASIWNEKCHCQLFHSWQRGQNLPENVLAWSWAALPGTPRTGDHMLLEVRAVSYSWEVCSTVELQFMIQTLALQNLQMCLISLNKCNAICLQCKRRALKNI